MNRRHFVGHLDFFPLAILLFALTAFRIEAGPTALELCSPENDDTFEVAKPLLFWNSSPGAKSYEVYVDGAKAGEAAAIDMPVMNYGVTAPLAPGLHHWSVNAISEVLFSKTDLTKTADQLDDCIMKPREPYESGQNRNCLWTNSIIQHKGQWVLYYGAGDRYVALATAPLK